MELLQPQMRVTEGAGEVHNKNYCQRNKTFTGTGKNCAENVELLRRCTAKPCPFQLS